MSDQKLATAQPNFSTLGFVDAPLVPRVDGESYWVRLVGNAAANRLLAGCIRARANSRPVLVHMSEAIPDYYYRVAQNDLLARAASEPSLGIMVLNIPLEMMRLGRIRGTLAEVAELVVAVDMPATLGAWYARELQTIQEGLPEASLISADELAEAADLFAGRADEAVRRYFAFDSPSLSETEMDVVVHEAYLRQVGQPVEVPIESEASEVVPFDPMGAGDLDAVLPADADAAVADRLPDEHMREYLLAVARENLSPVLARAFAAYGQYGDALAAQELKITKAPRKTLAALLRFMSARWDNIVIIYDSFDPWPMLDQKARVDVLASLMELRYIIGATGVMVLGVLDGVAPEIDEQFAAAEQVDWLLPEVHTLSGGDLSLDVGVVQSWLDGASLNGCSRLRVDGPEFAAMVSAASGELNQFAIMADAALRDAAIRGVSSLDSMAVEVGLAVGRDGAAT